MDQYSPKTDKWTDGEKGLFLAIEILDGESQEDLQGPIAQVAAAVGAEVFLSDDADPMKRVADELGLEHGVCQQHVVPNKPPRVGPRRGR